MKYLIIDLKLVIMKTFVLSLVVLCTSLISFSQTSYPCVKFYSTANLGGGDCQTAGTGGNKHYPGYLTQAADPNYTPTGKFVIYFKSPIPIGVAAPEITSAGIDDGSGNILLPGYDYKYAAYKDDITTVRSTVTYCYYGSASNQNIFNGSKAPFLAFKILYSLSDTSTCGGVTAVPSTLPVNFKTFSATRSNSSNSLKWTTSFESNNKGFYVQRFYNGQWTNVAFIASKGEGGFSSEDLNYTYSEVFNFKGVVQYRILQTDIDGRSKLSEIRSLSNGIQVNNVLIYPNPSAVSGSVSIVLADAAATYDIQVLDNAGRVVKEYVSVRNTQQVSSLPKGQYLARVTEKLSGLVSVEKFIMQ